MNDLLDAIKKYKTRYNERGYELRIENGILHLFKEGREFLHYSKTDLEELLKLRFDADVLANLVYLNFMNKKDLDEKAND